MKNKYLIPLVALLLNLQELTAQAPALTGLSQKTEQSLSQFHENYPQEKVYLQTDRNYYAVGETIWMKAWITLDGRPTYLSRILYVDLVNDEGRVIDKRMYHLDSAGSVSCEMQLKPDLVTGNYSVRAYTLWMLNFRDYIFTSSLYILGIDRKVASGTKITPQVLVQFFPEGGDLVNDLESVVAFKAYDQYGEPLTISGSITDVAGATVASITSDHDGMGTFRLTPAVGKSYTANITAANGRTTKVKLPEAKAEGVVMRINNNSLSRLSVILQRKAAQESVYNRLLIVAQMHNTVVFQGEVNFAEGASAASIPKKTLPPGIIQITIFDSLGTPLAERLAFVRSTNILAPELLKEKISLTRKAPNALSIDLKDIKRPNLSVCVTDVSADNLSAPVNILSASLLTSDLRGFVHNPNYYLSAADTTTNRHLDALMMTQGWRRFVWKDMLANKNPELKYPVESSIAVKGKATRPGTDNIIKEGKVNLVLKAQDSTSLISEAKLTDKGEFIVDNLQFKKNATVSYMATSDKKELSVIDVKLYPNYFDTLKLASLHKRGLFDYDPVKGNDRLNEILLNQLHAVDTFMKGPEYLKAVTVTGKKLSPADSLNKEYATGLFMFGGRKLDPGKTPFFSIWQMIRTVPGFVVEGDMKSPQVSLSRTAGVNVFSSNSGGYEGVTFADGEGNAPAVGAPDYVQNGIAFFLNEVPVSRETLDNLSMTDVAFIKTYVGAESMSVGPYNGVISVYTHKGASVGRSIYDKTFARTTISGYAPVREFFTPDYTQSPALQSLPDNRITLLWNPRLLMDKQGKAAIKFFNNDSSTKIKVLIQGLDADGRFIYREQILE
ncbi:MG2 domain-containing protein [Paraflavitalea sp. CAU 1676]|uniref:MG2 domain-containing protein n=1 Tax=Paraflavitalea sp. CAU 1676 TaxID=3032598 RepID=UPI0023DBA1A0|nr:MG2 domain-containing protein [Paraflavitalea sp. CAU 1676]MDF2192803.1 hypothetical protein [Paraflavitalea sp. CAU 1676]